jgi:dTDP-glucose 4,6-dehydratase
MPASHLFDADLQHVLAHTRHLWEPLRGRQLFLTGGTGFFGSWLVESFLWVNQHLDLGSRLLVLSRDPQRFARKSPHLAAVGALSVLQGNVTDFPFPNGEFSHVIHAATEAYDPAAGVDRLAVLDRDVQGTRRVLEFARQCGARRFLLTSSGAVYGRQPPAVTHIAEDFPGAPDTMHPDSGYGHGKRMSELLCAMYARAYGLETTIARCFAFAGPHLPLDANFAVGNFLRDAMRGGPITIQGDGTPLRSYLYAADLAIWLWSILLSGTPCRPYNVGSDAAISIAGLARTVADVIAPQAEIRALQTPQPNRPVVRYVPSIERAREELRLEPWISLADAIERTVRWHRS